MTKVSTETQLDLERFKLIVANTNDLIATIDMEGNFTYVSPSHEQVLGYKPKEMLGTNSFTYIHPEDVPKAMEELQRSIRGEKSALNMFRARHKKGKWIYLEATAATLFNRYKKPYMFVAILRDITSRIEYEHKKDEFLSVLSHELRTPMTGIMAYAALLEKELKDEKGSSRTYSVKLQEQTQVLADLVQSLVDVSEMQLGRLKLEYKPFLLNAMVKEMGEFTRKRVRNKIVFEGKEEIEVRADRKRLEDVVNSLLSNAVKYSTEPTPIHLNVLKKNGQAVVSVKDSGPGIRKSEHEKIFEKYYQIGNQKQYGKPGFGVGLFFAREIVTMHKGTIWVESKRNAGSTFFFSIPL